MSLRDDPRYFPQPVVPNNGNYGGSFGREQLYYDYLPRSAAIEAANVAAGEKTYSSGKYTFNPATGQYTWVPAGTVASNLGGNAGANMGDIGGGGQDRGGGGGSGTGGGLGVGPGQGVSSATQNTALGLMAFGDKYPAFAPLGFVAKGLGFLGGKLADSQMDKMAKAQEALAAIDKQNAAALESGSSRSFDPYGGTKGVMSVTDANGNVRSFDPYAGDSAKDAGRSFGGPSGAPPAGADAVADVPAVDATPAGADAVADVPGVGPQGEANGGMIGSYAQGGLGSLGGYSDGGRLLRGPGDGVSDSIPATIGRKKQPARLADGEFVVPARIVSELGNGSTEAGARKLYAMLARIQAGRKKSIGTNKVAVNSRMDKHLPA